MARDLGGAVERTDASEFGKAELKAFDSIFRDLPFRAGRVDEPSGLRHRSAERRSGDSILAVDADRCVRGSSPALVRRPVPPRGRAHAARQDILKNFLYEVAGMSPTQTPTSRGRGAGRAGPGAVGASASLRPVERHRLGHGGAAGAPPGRRQAHVRLRRPRPPARERGRAGRDVLRPLPASRSCTSGADTLPLPARRRFRSRADRRRGVHPRLRGGGAQLSASPHSSRDAYSQASSSPGAPRRGSRRRSSRTTTSAACPRTCGWSSSSRCACCSRTRCAAWARSSACLSAWSGASRSRGPGSRSGSSAGSRTEERLAILRRADAILLEENPPRRPVPGSLADVRGAPRDPLGRRAGRRAHVRVPDRRPGRPRRRTR